MREWLRLRAAVYFAAAAFALACSSQPYHHSPVGDSASSTSGGPPGSAGSLNFDPHLMPELACDPKSPGSPCSSNAATPPGCGDGTLAKDEVCDDGNTTDGDGCQGNCLGVAPGYSCNPPGKPCHELAVCGDRIVSASEQCDDGNDKPDDGCSAHCKFEIGYKCAGVPSVCTKTVCGDAKREGAESCDDGNDTPFDGCSSTCQTEPHCTPQGCTSDCGDGLVIDEECDDGNTKDGDGCSHDCKKEAGFACSQTAACEKTNGECVLRIPALFRDFNAAGSANGHPDFQVPCGGEAITPGLVKPNLNAAGKPELVKDGAACITSAATFEQWYTNSEKSHAIVGDLVLFKKAMGTGYVNRWGAMGEQWQAVTMQMQLGVPYATCMAVGCIPCQYDPRQGCMGTLTYYDGTPFFFPIDNAPNALMDVRHEASAAPDYGYNWAWERTIVPGAGKHNFHFTTEVKYWFQYVAANAPTLDFTGDDDVWVFVNGRLAVDIGGLHPPRNGTITLSNANAAAFGLTEGKVYAISIFHAERKTDGSSFRLTLDGFNSTRSECTPICGDGVVSLGEQCDDGVNDGGYGECGPGCVIGPYCGDGIVQPGEDCDDGNRLDGDACASSCRNVVVK